jgi:hypothetical protein
MLGDWETGPRLRLFASGQCPGQVSGRPSTGVSIRTGRNEATFLGFSSSTSAAERNQTRTGLV